MFQYPKERISNGGRRISNVLIDEDDSTIRDLTHSKSDVSMYQRLRSRGLQLLPEKMEAEFKNGDFLIQNGWNEKGEHTLTPLPVFFTGASGRSSCRCRCFSPAASGRSSSS
jgi:hypothetical protein